MKKIFGLLAILLLTINVSYSQISKLDNKGYTQTDVNKYGEQFSDETTKKIISQVAIQQLSIEEYQKNLKYYGIAVSLLLILITFIYISTYVRIKYLEYIIESVGKYTYHDFIVEKILRYIYSDCGGDYNRLTSDEKSVLSKEEFDALKKKYKNIV